MAQSFVVVELTNLDDDEGRVVGEGSVPPRSYAIEDGLWANLKQFSAIAAIC